MDPLVACEEATETVWAVAMQQSKYWKTIDTKSCEPKEGDDISSGILDALLNNMPIRIRGGRHTFPG